MSLGGASTERVACDVGSGAAEILTRENQLLLELKRVLEYPGSTAPDASADAFLRRCLMAAHFSVSEALTLLKQRRYLEESLPSVRVTAPVLAALRSGAISIIGRDVLGRPVLYLSAQRFTQPALDVQDIQRLVIIVMEYMLAYSSHSLLSSYNRQRTDKIPPTKHDQRQEFIVIANEENSTWHANHSVLVNMSILSNVITKYYPCLIGLILIFEASWDVRQGIKESFSEKMTEAKRIVRMVTRAEIQNYVDPSVLPQEVGGRNKSIDGPDVFADAVLRHWYLKTSYLLLDESYTRPLWQMAPFVMSTDEWAALHRRSLAAITSVDGAMNTPPLISRHYRRRSSPPEPMSLCSSRRSHGFCAGSDGDDGFCSALSEPDELGYTLSSLKAVPGDVLDVENNGGASSQMLIRELQRERELRIEAEQQLQKMCLGITLDLSTATHLERTLACIHGQLNVLIGNIIVRAREAMASGPPPSLLQLLDLTLSAVEKAAHKAEHVPAMKFALPAPREATKNSLCCSLM